MYLAFQRYVIPLLMITILSCGSPAVSADELEEARQRIQPVASDAEVEGAIASCLQENAVTSIKRQPNGGFGGEAVTERDLEILDECRTAAFARFDWPPPRPSTAAEHRVLYDLYLEMAACLENLGETIDVISFDRYLDLNGDWYPYDALPQNPTPVDWALWNDSCPQDPWTYAPSTGSD